MCHSQIENYQLDLHLPMAYPPFIKEWASQNLLMMDTTAALPVLHVFRGTGKANMHELIMEWTQTVEGRNRVWCKKCCAFISSRT